MTARAYLFLKLNLDKNDLVQVYQEVLRAGGDVCNTHRLEDSYRENRTIEVKLPRWMLTYRLLALRANPRVKDITIIESEKNLLRKGVELVQDFFELIADVLYIPHRSA